MTRQTVICPNCKTGIPLTETLLEQIREQVRKEVGAEAKAREEAIYHREGALKEGTRQLEESKEKFDQQLAERVKQEEEKIRAFVVEEVRSSNEVEMGFLKKQNAVERR